MKNLDHSLKALILVMILAGIVGLGYFGKIQWEKKINQSYNQGQTDYQNQINAFIVNSLTETGELKIRYQGPEDQTTDIILVPKNNE